MKADFPRGPLTLPKQPDLDQFPLMRVSIGIFNVNTGIAASSLWRHVPFGPKKAIGGSPAFAPDIEQTWICQRWSEALWPCSSPRGYGRLAGSTPRTGIRRQQP